MGNAGGILGNSLKGYAECLVDITVFDCQGRGAQYCMFKEVDRGIDLADEFFSRKNKPVIGGAAVKICHKGTGKSELFVGIKQQGNGSIIGQIDLHHGLKSASTHIDTMVADPGNKVAIELLGMGRAGGM